MGERLFDLERVDADAVQRVAARLREAGFTEDGVRERLRVQDLPAIALKAFPFFIHERLARRDPLDVAIILFLLEGVVAVEELDPLLDKPSRKLLKELGVFLPDRATRTYRAAASLFPLRDRLFFADHRFRKMPWLKSRAPRDPVMYLGLDTHYLARTTIRRRARAALDLCTGSGVHAILTAAHAERSIGVDVNPRAVNFAKLNAILNDCWNVVFVEGDLFHPVGGERFDLILANPPFVPSPVYELRYRDGGPSGADVLRRVIASIPDYLATTGVAQIVTQIGERDGEGYLERVRRWLGGANLNVHALKVGEDSVQDYVQQQAAGDDFNTYANAVKAWAENLRTQRFTRIIGVILTFEWNEEGANPPWSREDEAKPPMRPIGDEIARVLLAKRRARAPGALKSLDRCRAGVPDDLLLIERRRPTGKGFETKDFRVTFRDPVLTAELEVKPLIRDLLERIDNRSTVPEIIARYAKEMRLTIEDVDEKCRRAFLAMLERGLVTLDEIGAAAPPVEVHARASRSEAAVEALIGPPAATHAGAAAEDPLAVSGGEERAPVPAPAEPRGRFTQVLRAEGGALDALAAAAAGLPEAAPAPAPRPKPPPPPGGATVADDEFGLADLDEVSPEDIAADAREASRERGPSEPA